MSENRNKIAYKFVRDAIMCIAYLCIAYLVAFTTTLLPYNFRQGDTENDDFLVVRIVLALALLLYGLFRGYNAIKLLRK